MPTMVLSGKMARNGMWTYFSSLRSALRPFGWSVQCVAVGAEARGFDPALVDEDCFLIGRDLSNQADEVTHLLAWLRERSPEVLHVLGNAGAGDRAVPHLHRSTRSMLSLHGMSRGSFEVALPFREHFNLLVCVNEAQRSTLGEGARGVPPVVVIRHGLARPGQLGRSPRGPGPLRIGYVGVLQPWKGVELIPRIASRLASAGVRFSWDVIGEGPSRPKLQRDLQRRGVAASVQLLGSLEPAEVASRLGGFDALVVPSYTESFGFVIAEGLLAGCAVVASDLQGQTDALIRHRETGLLVRRGDVSGFASALAELAEEPARCEELGARGREWAERELSLEGMGRAYAHALAGMLAAPDLRPPPLPIEELTVPRAWRRSGWRSWIPKPVKHWARALGLLQ